MVHYWWDTFKINDSAHAAAADADAVSRIVANINLFFSLFLTCLSSRVPSRPRLGVVGHIGFVRGHSGHATGTAVRTDQLVEPVRVDV